MAADFFGKRRKARDAELLGKEFEGMKKRTMHISISNLMISVMVGLTACGNQTVPESSVKSNEQIEKETTTVETVSEEIDDEASVVEESQELVGSIRYDYEQELNIIDDN